MRLSSTYGRHDATTAAERLDEALAVAKPPAEGLSAGSGPQPESDAVPLSRMLTTLPPGALSALAVTGVLAVLLAVGYFWRSVPEPLPDRGIVAAVGAPPSPQPGATQSPSPDLTPRAGLAVHVIGLVRDPGIVQLRPGARIADAIEAAGGPATGADLSSVNLARPAVDGEQVALLGRGRAAGRWTAPPQPAAGGAPGASAAAGGGAGSGAGAPVDLNTAGVEQLETLPGVGPVLAARILEWRTRNGRFSSVEELREVEGIGDRKFAGLSSAVQVR